MKLLRERSVLYKYILSYSTVVLVACTVLGLLFFLYSSHELQKSNIQAAKNKLDIFCEDLNNQYMIMDKVAVDIRLSDYFHSSFIKMNKYNELEMLAQFTKYQSYSPIINKYFLIFHNNDTIYTGDGTTVDASTMFSAKLKISDWVTVYEQLNKMLEQEQPTLLDNKDYLMFIFPIRDGSSSSYSKSVVFSISKEVLLKRFEFLTGVTDGGLKIQINMGDIRKNITLGSSKLSDNLGKDEISSGSADSYFKVSVDKSALSDIKVIRQFRIYFVTIFMTILLLLLLFGTTIAYNNYKPIRQLLLRLSGNVLGGRTTSDELNKIEILFQEKSVDESYRKEQFEKQLYTLREHMAKLVRHAITMRTEEQREWLLHLTRMLKENNAASSKELLRNHLSELSEAANTMYPEKLFFADLLMALLSWANEQEINFSQIWLESSLEVETTADFLALVEPMLDELADEIIKKQQYEKTHLMESIVSYIRNHCCAYDMSLELLSTTFSINNSQISRMLKEEYGVNFKDFLVELRMEKAKCYLISTELPVSEVSSKVGYNSPSHFIKIFKKATGNVPSFYRNYDKKNDAAIG